LDEKMDGWKTCMPEWKDERRVLGNANAWYNQKQQKQKFKFNFGSSGKLCVRNKQTKQK
jgi:hypothetical protein